MITQIFCPYCGGTNILRHVAEWDATSKDDPDNTCELDEHQCKDCEGVSFWL